MEYVIAFTIFAVVLVVPIMIGARLVDARNTGFGSALLAVVVLAVISAAIDGFVADDLVAFIATAAIGAMVLAGVLGTTFFRGLAISVIAAIIQIVVMIVFAAAVVGSGAVVP